MKRNLLLALMLMFNIIVFAQSRAFIVNESFNTPNMPEGWYFTGEGSDNFSIKTSNNAGGDPNELHLKSSPFITSGIHLVMASADMTGVSEAGISFKHYLANYQQSSTIGIATSSDDGATWNTAWSQTYSASGQHQIDATISTADMGKSNVLFCLFFEGNTYNIDNWYFDDIRIFTQGGGEEGEASLQLSNIDVESIVPSGATDIEFTVNNTGTTAISSFEARYMINDSDAVTETFQTNLTPAGNGQFTFTTKANLTPGTFTITIDILSVNGTAVNDINITKDVKTYIKTVARTPMIEHFSSSTCGPCVQVDNEMMGLTHDNEGKYTYTKFPVAWPGAGDPYTTDECDTRAMYYEAYIVPVIALDGQTQYSSVSQEELNNRLNATSYLNIVGAFETDNNIIKVTADIISYIDMPDVKVFLSVNEKTTTENIGTNGATEFHHILMKMLGDDDGIETSFKAGEYQRFEFSHDMSTTFMEEIDDLEVSVWVQNYESKEIHNSSFLHEYMQHPYPAQNLQVNNEGTNTVISWNAPEQGTPIGYNVYINNNLVAENTTNNSYSASTTEEIHFVEVVAVYENDIHSIGITNMRSVETFAPENVTATGNEDEGNITVTWNAVNDAVSYKLYRNNNFLTDVNATSYTDNDIELGVTYCYTVRSVYADNVMSTFSQESCAHAGELPCNAPTNISAEIVEDAPDYEYKFKATVTWDAVTGAEYYAFYVNGELFGYSSSTAYIVGSDQEGSYDINVVTVCENGESEFSETYKLIIKGIGIEELENKVNIYPNPVDDILYIETNEIINEIVIYDVKGSKVFESPSLQVSKSESLSMSESLSISVSSLKPGVYFVKINCGDTVLTDKFIKK